MSKPSKQIVIPLTREELDKLDFKDVVALDNGLGGAFASAFDIKRGVERWVKAGCPSVLDKSEFAKTMEMRHQSFVNKLSAQHEDEISLHVSTSEKEVNALQSKLSEAEAVGLSRVFELDIQCKGYKSKLQAKESELDIQCKGYKSKLQAKESELDKQSEDYKSQLITKGYEIEGVKKSASESEDSLRRSLETTDNARREYIRRLTGNWFRRFIVTLFNI